MKHWIDEYVGMPYVIDTFDCVGLISLVYKQELQTDLELPTERNEGVFLLSQQIAESMDDYVDNVSLNKAQDFDVVLMKHKGKLNHTGLFFRVGNVPYVLHNIRSINQVVAHKIKDLEKINLFVEGIYRFKNKDIRFKDEQTNKTTECNVS